MIDVIFIDAPLYVFIEPATTAGAVFIEGGSSAAAEIAAHEAAADPHPQYMTAAEVALGFQPLDSDLTAIAALSTTAYGRAFLALADAAAGRVALALGSAATHDATDFDAAGAASTAAAGAYAAAVAASQPLDSDLSAIAALSTTAFGRALLTMADAAALRTAAGLGTLATQSGTFSGTSSGTNTGDQDLSGLALKSTTVNGHPLSSNVVVSASDVGAPSGSGTSSGTNTGDQTSVTGNAGTATKLATARNIDGQAFDGSADITVIAPGTHAAVAKVTPVDADEFALVDSAAANVLKKLSWANLKAALKTFFDPLYNPLPSYTWTGKPAANSVPAGYMIRVTDVGISPGSRWVSDGTSEWRPDGIIILAKGTVAVSGANDTNENQLSAITVLGGVPGTNRRIRLTGLFDVTNGANNKTLRVRFSGAAGTAILSIGITTNASYKFIREIVNRNSASSQVCESGTGSGGWAGSSVATITTSVDTTVDTTIVITVQKATGTDAATLTDYLAELIP